MNSYFRNSGQRNTVVLCNRVKTLRREERRFMLAYKDENNNEAMRLFCERGLEKIRKEISHLEGMI